MNQFLAKFKAFFTENNIKIIKKVSFILFLIVAAIYGYKCSKGNDWLSYYDVAINFRHLLPNIYVPGELSGMINHYPPVFAMLLAPLSLLHPFVAGYLFYALKIFLLIMMIKTMPAFFEKGKYSSLAMVIAVVMVARYINDDLKLGQINLLLVELMVFSLYFKMRGKLLISALLIALATSIKIFPGLFILFFLFQKEWKLVLYASISIVVLNILPAIFYGGGFIPLFNHFLQESVYNAAAAPNSETANQSIYGMFMRFLGHNTTDTKPFGFVNILSLSFEQIRLVYYASGIGALILVFWSALKKKENAFIYQASIIFIIALIFPMVTRKANFVMLLFPALVVFNALFTADNMKKYLKVLVWVGFFLVALTADGFVGRNMSNIFESFSTILIGTFIFLFVNVVFLSKENKTHI